jgi:hypothetical protein
MIRAHVGERLAGNAKWNMERRGCAIVVDADEVLFVDYAVMPPSEGFLPTWITVRSRREATRIARAGQSKEPGIRSLRLADIVRVETQALGSNVLIHLVDGSVVKVFSFPIRALLFARELQRALKKRRRI